MLQAFSSFLGSTGIAALINSISETISSGGNILEVIGTPLMIVIACVLLYLAIVKKFEPLLLLPIAFGVLLTNMPMFQNSGAILMHNEFFTDPAYLIDGHLDIQRIFAEGGLLDLLYLGVKLGIYPPLIFLGIGIMTDFGPLIANPKSILLGAAAQFGVFITFLGALALGAAIPAIGFGVEQAASIGIIGGADGPTAIYVTKTLAPELLPAIAIAAYSYMALIPVIQPPIMKGLTTKKERSIVMEQLRPVSKRERILFPIIVTIVVALIVPDAVALVGMLMLGNLIKESGVADRLAKTAQNGLMNVITIFLGLTVGNRKGRNIPYTCYTRYSCAWSYCILFQYCRRFAARQTYVQTDPRKSKSAYRFSRSISSSDGSPCITGSRTGGKPLKLPAHARYGSECCRSYRFCRCGRRIPRYVRSLILK